MSSPCIAILGQGTVGSGVLHLLKRQWPHLQHLTNNQIDLRWICDRHLPHGRLNAGPIKNIQSAPDPRFALQDPKVNIVIEVLGGAEETKNLVFKAIQTNRHVITANKLLISTQWKNLSLASSKNNRRVLFEAAVASGLPIIQTIKESLKSSPISQIRGILNGTTNYILTRMEQDSLTFGQALQLAQQHGFAEANPKLDLNGHDTAYKLSILASLATGKWINPKNIFHEGLQGIDLQDIRFVREELNSNIRLIGHFASSSNQSASFQCWVSPCLIERTHPLAAVNDENNAIAITTEAAGELYFQGKGAGSLPAASAVISDLINLVRYWNHPVHEKSLPMERPIKKPALDPEISSEFYLRAQAQDKPGTLAQLTSLLARHQISIQLIHQAPVPRHLPRSNASIMILTHRTKKSTIRAALQESARRSDFLFKTALPRLPLNS